MLVDLVLEACGWGCCRALEEQILEEALAGCPKLKSADLLHSQAAPSQVTRLSQRGASLKAAAS